MSGADEALSGPRRTTTGHRRPGILSVLNASPDSFSENRVDARAAADVAAAMVADGADVLDIGAQSLRTDRPEIPVEEEISRLLPVLHAVRERLPDIALSVDTYRHQVAAAALDVGVAVLNDPSGLLDPGMAELAAAAAPTGDGAAPSIVVAFNPGVPKHRLPRGERLADPVGDCIRFVTRRLELLQQAGVGADRVILDPGPDLHKAPDETIDVLAAVPRLRTELGIDRVLWAVSRKDFVGVLTGRIPRERGAGTLGVLASVDLQEQDLVRVHDVAATVDFLTVRQAMIDGSTGPLEMDDAIRYDPS